MNIFFHVCFMLWLQEADDYSRGLTEAARVQDGKVTTVDSESRMFASRFADCHASRLVPTRTRTGTT